MAEGSDSPCGVAAVVRPETAVDEDESIVGFDEQHVTYQ